MLESKRSHLSAHDRLLHFVGAIHDSLDIARLGAIYMDAIHSLVPATGFGFYLTDGGRSRPTRLAVRGTVERFVLRYEETGYECDPLLQHVSATHEPVHDGLLFSDTEWQRHPLREALSMRRLVRMAAAPLVIGRRTAGMLIFTRGPDEPFFTDSDLDTLKHIAQHTSAALTNASQYGEVRERCRLAEDALNLTNDAIVLSDDRGSIRFVNKLAHELVVGSLPEDASTAHFSDALERNLSDLRSTPDHVTVGVMNASGSRSRVGEPLVIRSVRLPAAPHAVASFLYQGERHARFPQLEGLLSPREIEVLDLLAQGLQNKQIAQRLFISTNTVKFHLKRMFQTMGVSCRSELLAKAYQRAPGGLTLS